MTILDRERALEQAGGDRELLAELVELFAEDRDSLVQQIRSGLAAGDPACVARASHTLKGSLATLAAGDAARIALEIEQFGREGNLAGAADALPGLERELERLQPELEALTTPTT